MGYTSRPENRPEGSIERSFIGCFTDIDILNTGNGYSPEDEITITPNVENLRVSVQMNDLGQIIAMEVLDEVPMDEFKFWERWYVELFDSDMIRFTDVIDLKKFIELIERNTKK